MRQKIVVGIVLFALCFTAGCLTPTVNPDKPRKLFEYPDTVTSPKAIEYFLRMKNAQYASDEVTTGYKNYYFTPAELAMKAIPDVNNHKRIIYKQPFHGDCDDWALMTAYLAQEALGYEAHYVHIYPQNDIGTPGHALSYAIDSEGKTHVWNLWYYYGTFKDFDTYMKRFYPDMKITLDVSAKKRIAKLYNEGHVLYYTDKYEKKEKKSSCSAGFCAVESRPTIIWGVNYYKY